MLPVLPECLADAVAARSLGRGVYAASVLHRLWNVAESASTGNVRTVKRPEGRAPPPILAGTLNTYLSEAVDFRSHFLDLGQLRRDQPIEARRGATKC